MDEKAKTSENEGKGKGKGKEPSEETDGKSMATRIADSAAALTQSLMNSRPTGDDISSAIANEKSQPGGPPRSAVAGGSAEPYSRPSEAASSSQAFRDGQTNHHIAQEEQAFSEFLDTQVPVAEEPRVLPYITTSSALPVTDGREPGPSYGAGPALTVADQERHDGAEVLQLLSQGDIEPPEYDEGPELSNESLDSLRAALFTGGSSAIQKREWDTLLNFIPDFVRPDAGDRADAATSNPEKSLETHAAMGLDHSQDTSRLWVEQWHDVLTAYTDEVWGDLTPLVQQARKEVEQLQQTEPDQPPPNTKALQRLRLLLGHIREQ